MAQQTQLTHHGPLIGQYETYKLIDCSACGFIHVDPLPEKDDLKELYTTKFYSADKPEYLQKYEAELPYWREAVFRVRYDCFETLLPQTDAPKKLLDIGCSGGFFVAYGRDRGWNTLGIEPGPEAAQYAREVSKVNVIEDYFQNLPKEKYQESFDVIHLRNVLEHLPNPAELCQLAYSFLKPGGLICIESPNDFNPLQKLAHQTTGISQYWVSIPHHLNYFTKHSLDTLLEKSGYEIVHHDASFPLELFLLMGENYIQNPSLGAGCHTKRMQLESSLMQSPETLDIRNKLYSFFANLGLGRTIITFARKNSP